MINNYKAVFKAFVKIAETYNVGADSTSSNFNDVTWYDLSKQINAGEWEECSAPISEDVFNQFVSEYDSQEYARNRLEAYNALNQFELISDDSINGTTTHKDAILAIKAKFPKP
jgi:hypothetical protein